MDVLSHLLVLVSIIVGLGLTELVGGLARLMQARGRARVDWIHLVWTFNVFLLFLINWWMDLRWDGREEWPFHVFLFIFLYPTLLYVQSVLLFPSDVPDGFDFWRHFLAVRRWFFGLAMLLILVDWSDAFFKGAERRAALGGFYWSCTAALLVLHGVAFASPNRKLHGAYAIGFCLLHLWWIGSFPVHAASP